MTKINTTPERARYDDMRARAVAGEHVAEDELMHALDAAINADKRAEHAAALDTERAQHKADEKSQIAKARKAGEKKLNELVSKLVEAQEIRAQAHQTMKDSITEYDRTAQAESQAVYALAAALRESGYPDRRPNQGAESVHVHEKRHFDGMSGTVFFDDVAGHRAEAARHAIPRFLNGIEAA